MDWRKAADALPLEVRRRTGVVTTAWQLHCLSHRLEDAWDQVEALEQRRRRLVAKWETLTSEAANGQLQLPGVVHDEARGNGGSDGPVGGERDAHRRTADQGPG